MKAFHKLSVYLRQLFNIGLDYGTSYKVGPAEKRFWSVTVSGHKLGFEFVIRFRIV